MPAVNGVGKPCAGKPHARFDGRGLETEQPDNDHRGEAATDRETRGKWAAGPTVRRRHRASPRPYRWLEVRLLIVLLPGFGCGVCLAGGGGRVTQPGGARVRTGSDRAGLCLLSCQ